MSILDSFESVPFFATGTDLHVTDGLDVLWTNTRALDLATLRLRDAMQSHAEHRVEFIHTNPLAGWWGGGFRFATGLTTLTVTTYTHSLGTSVAPRVRVLLNGVNRGEWLLAAGLQTHTLTISGLGYAHGQVVETRLQIVDPAAPTPDLGEPANSGSPRWGRYDVLDAYVGPLSATVTTPWPDEPNWSTSPTSAQMTLLGARCNWLAERVGLVPWPLWQRIFNTPGLFWAPTTYHLWSGAVTRGVGTRLVVQYQYIITTNTAERFRLLINGAEVATTPVLTAGNTSWNGLWDVNISGYSASVPLRLEIQSVITAARDADAGGRPSRFTLTSCRVERGSSGHLVMPARTAPDESLSWSQLRSRLYALNSILLSVRDRITSAPDLFDRARLFRAGYAYDEGARLYLATRHTPIQQRRAGRRLVVHGKNIRVGWGPVAILPPEERDGEVGLEFGSSETLTAADRVETREIWLDQLPGLELGMTYVLTGGDVRYAAEFLR
ncbi:MAG TPA: hypothetical protein PKD53_04715 [Chloroflexaceae bacterium]|nr:hypothetical protein [Chloroflexaceae bacterium]